MTTSRPSTTQLTTYSRGDKVVVYEDDLTQKARLAKIVCYRGYLKKSRYQIYTVRFEKGQACSDVSEEWIRPYEEPLMSDTRSYLEALNDLS